MRINPLGALSLALATLLLAPATAPAQILPHTPRLLAPEARLPIELARVDVQTRVLGQQAQTRIELELRNPNERPLEASLEFPLAEGQTVSGFALDIAGEMVAAVPVPKDKGRQVFDDVTRRRVDPALLERSAGNTFRLRVYPLPAQGQRRVVLQIAQDLLAGPDGRLQYRLPLDFGQRIGRFSAELVVPGVTDLQGAGALAAAAVANEGGDAVLHLNHSAWLPGEPLQMQWRAGSSPLWQAAEFDGRRYFQADVPLDAAPGAAVLPHRLLLVWDASGSGATRDHAREFALLDALFAAAPALQVQLQVARDVAEPVRAFEVRAGDWRALRKVLEQLPYDGASSAAAWVPPAVAGTTDDTLALLFSDGLANWPGQAAAPALALNTVNAAQRADAQRLRRLAEDSGGRYLDLLTLTPNQALQALIRPSLRLLEISATGAEQVVSASVHPENGRLRLAGVLTAAQARLTLQLGDGHGRVATQQIDLAAPRGPAADTPSETVPTPARRWAELTVARLEGRRDLHRAEIRRLGQQFRLVDSESSLIVLDNVGDYLRYDIVPPAGALRAEFLQRQQQAQAGQRQSRSAHVDALARRYAERQRWWERDFPKEGPPPPKLPPPPTPMSGRTAAMASAPAPSPMMATSLAPAAMHERQSAERAAPSAAHANASAVAGPPALIALRRWEPDAPYARRLREAAANDRYAIYLDERAALANSTAFFIDAADVFFDRGETALALRVLSNLAEMELANRHILRILAYRLQQAGQAALAIPLLERVRELAPDEPQSWRDLGLALAADGQDRAAQQRALELLWEVASRPWDARFSDIDLIALVELNALLARTPALDASRVDPRLLRNLPLDLRAVLSWDADNTDIDLWVIDPNGEKTYYGNRLSYQGGAMTRDFTAGYGPEEFALRLAKPGRYEVRAEFFGHNQQIVSPYTTLMLWLSTGFGTPAQHDERVVLRLNGRREQVLVGTFEVQARRTGALP